MSATKPKLKLKKIKGSSNILHIDTNFVFKSLEEKIVIGKYVDDEIKMLDKTDIETCNSWKLSFDSDKILGENEDEDENENEDKQEENESSEDTQEDEVEVDSVVNTEEKNDNPEEVTEEAVAEDTYINISLAPSSKHILDITSQFSKDIHNHFDLVTQFYTDKITTYENKISKLDIQVIDLISKLDAECQDHINTKEDLNKLKIKFEGIKSLFN